MSLGVGLEVGVPINQKIVPEVTFESKGIVQGYRPIGFGASAISRVDANFFKYFNLFLAGTVHHVQTFDQKSSVGTFKGQAIGSFAISAGIGFNIGGGQRR